MTSLPDFPIVLWNPRKKNSGRRIRSRGVQKTFSKKKKRSFFFLSTLCVSSLSVTIGNMCSNPVTAEAKMSCSFLLYFVVIFLSGKFFSFNCTFVIYHDTMDILWIIFFEYFFVRRRVDWSTIFTTLSSNDNLVSQNDFVDYIPLWVWLLDTFKSVEKRGFHWSRCL